MSSSNPQRHEDSNDKKEDSGNIKVHSANSWETADLGDQSRNNKFLRLMGASKKQHTGKFVIGDQDPSKKRSGTDSRHLNEDLESQYEHSMEHRLIGGRRGHIGLGFTAESDTVAPSVATDRKDSGEKDDLNSKETEEKDDLNKTSESDRTCLSEDKKHSSKDDTKHTERKRESTDNSDHSTEKKMKFVKSSS